MSTLIEKFKNVFIQHYSNDWEKQCVNVAEEFAIGFAEWCTKYRELNSNVYGKTLYAKSKYDDVFLIEELLEMYKMEKGL
jgi:hypothetical protein